MGTSHDKEFEKLSEAFTRFMLRSYPVQASFLGVHDHDQDLCDFSPSGLKGRKDKLNQFKKSLKSVNKRVLSEDNGVDLELMQGRVEMELATLQKNPPHTVLPEYYLNEIFLGVYVLIAREFAPVRERALSATRRLAQVQNQLKNARKHLSNPPDVFVDSALKTVEGSLGFFKNTVPEFANQVRGALKEALLEVNQETIEELEKFAQYLEEELRPASKGNFAIGKTVYNQILKYEHKLDYGADKLLKIANSQIKAIEKELDEVAQQINKKKSWIEILDGLSKDHPSAQGLVGAYKKEIKQARAFIIKEGLMSVPEEEELNVEPTPVFARPLIPYSSYLPPAPFDEQSAGTFWVTTTIGLPSDEAIKRLKGHSMWRLPLIAIHEAYPGHHLQHLRAANNRNLLRHLIQAPIFTEGWGFYCEELMWEHDYNKNPKLRLVQLRDALWRAYRVIIDVGLHSKTINITQATKLLIEKVGLEEPNAESEVLRYCQTPTQPMCFLAGKLEIEKLRDDYAKKKGDAFSLKDFHDELLSHGPIPVSAIRCLMGL